MRANQVFPVYVARKREGSTMARPRSLPAGVKARKNADGTTSYVVRWREPTGQARTVTFRDAEQAIARKQEIDGAIRVGSYVPVEASRTLFSVVAAQWMETRVHLRPSSRHRDETMLRTRV